MVAIAIRSRINRRRPQADTSALMHHIEITTRPTPAQLDQLPGLLERAALADGHEPLGEHKFLRLQQGDDLANALFAFENDRLVGYAHTLAYAAAGLRRVSCEFVVHPEARAAGVGAQLIAAAVREARAQNAGRLDVWAYNDAPGGSRLLREAGFTAARRLLHLHRHVNQPVATASPPGLVVRPFTSGDEETLLRLNNAIFAGHPEQGTWTMEDIGARMTQPWFNPDDLLLLESDGAPAGFCWLKVEERGVEGLVGEVYVIGTTPVMRGRGAGRLLLARALQRMAERRVRVAAIYVDETNEAAVALYQSCGFHYHHVDVCYTLELGAERPLGERIEAAA